ncbi:hypothetical protein [Methylobacterium planeticum]|uniref:Uncharacterized protein n=1 Tax=Methylobacterium planeticum TaxID=2615211 RepID=A0A6N6MMM8_9HYPH|nr:hypothetical protein [Methylobacterium planeticum]KAB1070303.1 hypothetical protein F6X51_23100 [Methylobacterium planeticum]
MTRFETSELARDIRPREVAEDGGDDEPACLSAAAEATLRQVSDALGITMALFSSNVVPLRVQAGETVGLHEASALIQAYLRIDDATTRQRCLAFVQSAAV